MTCNVHIGDTTTFVVQIVDCDGTPEDLTASVMRYICLKDPTGEANNYSANFYTDGTDGKLYIRATTEMINKRGTWQVQGFATFVDGNEFHSEKEDFEVEPNVCT